MEAKTLNPIDQELDRLENEMRRLKIEYDIFFNGGAVRPPIDTKGRVDTTIKRLYDTKGLTFGQRFRYNGLVARYNVLRELWRRQQADREEIGRPPTVEAATALRDYSVVIQCRDPRSEPETVSEIYDQVIAARRECGERVSGLTLEAFTRFLHTKSDRIKQELASDNVEFVVGVHSGQVKFTVRSGSAKR